MAYGIRPVDWGLTKLLTFGTLLMEGTPVRLSGEDIHRATFVQRHAVLHDFLNGREFTPLQFLTAGQTRFDVYDSPLSECTVLAFGYGYSMEHPDALTIWEIRFGDFANGAQTVIDEFIYSVEQKRGWRSPLIMLLPHGYEGQGSDHSSARIERYLQLVAQDNMWVVQPSTLANHFHMLRRQAYQRPRHPLITFAPRQLLRLSAATSSIEKFTSGSSRPVIDGVDLSIDPSAMTHILLCSGYVYYDLLRERGARSDRSTAIVRLERLYPLLEAGIRGVLGAYPSAQVSWIQDEPQNQGMWPFLTLNMFMEWSKPVCLVPRPESATIAAGRVPLHKA